MKRGHGYGYGGPRAFKRPTRGTYKPYTKKKTAVQYGGRYSVPNGEMKFHDVDLDDAVIEATGAITASINLIPQGVTEKTRIGRKCTIRSIGWKFQMQILEGDAQATPVNADTVRVIMYVDKQANKLTAAVTDILETADFQSFNNLANSGRFRTLMDRTYDLNPNAIGSDGAGLMSTAGKTLSDSFYKKCNIPIEFTAGTGAITEITSNNIGVLLISGQDEVTFFGSKIRLRFSDG